ncbi:hypothetical protein XENORESO_012667 [Xenotaenia resolanae]|uniref:Uncharacterized protein n=1 Tax=Xenotaenia resolanae TaxID=208358 RepID=A0ABV0W5M3_9TELE
MLQFLQPFKILNSFMFKNTAVECGRFIHFWLSLFKTLNIAFDKAEAMHGCTRVLFLHTCQLNRRLEPYAYLRQRGWECLLLLRRQEQISDSRPGPADRGHCNSGII